MVSNLSTTNGPPKEAIEAACAMLNEAEGTNYWKPKSDAGHSYITTLATVIGERNALIAKYEPKPDPLLAEADELLARHWEDDVGNVVNVANARAGRCRVFTPYKAILFTLQQRDKEI